MQSYQFLYSNRSMEETFSRGRPPFRWTIQRVILCWDRSAVVEDALTSVQLVIKLIVWWLLTGFCLRSVVSFHSEITASNNAYFILWSDTNWFETGVHETTGTSTVMCLKLKSAKTRRDIRLVSLVSCQSSCTWVWRCVKNDDYWQLLFHWQK